MQRTVYIRGGLCWKLIPTGDILLRREEEPGSACVYFGEVHYPADALCSMSEDTAKMLAGDIAYDRGT